MKDEQNKKPQEEKDAASMDAGQPATTKEKDTAGKNEAVTEDPTKKQEVQEGGQHLNNDRSNVSNTSMKEEDVTANDNGINTNNKPNT